MSELELIFNTLMGLFATGFVIAVPILVIAAGFKIGWKLAPWVLLVGFICWVMI
tara:strand:- start:828 stop:989 length:162 start_codon:yes stop_codon:yes gene_type:complete